jgi:hypothetical protein
LEVLPVCRLLLSAVRTLALLVDADAGVDDVNAAPGVCDKDVVDAVDLHPLADPEEIFAPDDDGFLNGFASG